MEWVCTSFHLPMVLSCTLLVCKNPIRNVRTVHESVSPYRKKKLKLSGNILIIGLKLQVFLPCFLFSLLDACLPGWVRSSWVEFRRFISGGVLINIAAGGPLHLTDLTLPLSHSGNELGHSARDTHSSQDCKVFLECLNICYWALDFGWVNSVYSKVTLLLGKSTSANAT